MFIKESIGFLDITVEIALFNHLNVHFIQICISFNFTQFMLVSINDLLDLKPKFRFKYFVQIFVLL